MSGKAIIAEIQRTVPIEGADRIHTAFVLGQQVVVSKDWFEGMLGVFFEPDTQLSEEFCKFNNLYRHSHLNADQEKKGFFEDNRRVRCQPFLKVKSEGFFTTIDSLAFTNHNTYFNVGDQFSELKGVEVCKKYISPKTLKAMNNAQKKKTKTQEAPMFHKHVDTDQFAYYVDKIPAGALLSFHHKVHGTSGRYSHSKVIRQPQTFWDKLKDKLGVFERERWEYLVGTRNVVLYEEQYDKEGFHGSEQFRFDVMEELKPFLEKGMTVYGELAGYANGSPIMGTHSTKALKNKEFTKKYGEQVTYKYGCVEDTMRFHIYRISYTTEEGTELDFTDQQVHDWCERHSFLSPVEVHKPFVYDGSSQGKEELVKLVKELTERPDVLTEDYVDPSHVNEGIIIRVDYKSQVPKFYKSKSYAFKVMEGIFKEDNVDLEDAS